MAKYTFAKEFNTTAIFEVETENPIQAAQKFQEIIDKISNEIFDSEYKVEGKCNFYGQDIVKVTEFLEYNINEENAMIYDECFNVYDLSGIELPRKTLDDDISVTKKDILSKTG